MVEIVKKVEDRTTISCNFT